MAYIDPNQAAQINQTLNAMKSTLQNISTGLSTASPSVVQQIAPSLSSALSSASNVLGSVKSTVSSGGGGGGYSAPSPSSLPPATTQAAAQPSSQDQYTQGLQNLISQYSQILSKYQNPPTPDTSKISSIYNQASSDLKSRYEKMLQDLQKKQQEDQQRLAGRYAAAGFSEPGILGGQAAGVPGVATKGMKELEAAQTSDITNLQQAEAGDLNALAAAQASAEQQAQQQAIDNYYKQLQLMQGVLGQQAGLLTYKTPEQQLAEELKKEALYKQLGLGSYAKTEGPKTEITGDDKSGRYLITYDNNGRVLSKQLISPPVSTVSDGTSGNATSGSGFFSNIAVSKVNDIMNNINDNTVGIRSILSRMIPGTDAYYFNQQLEALKSDLAFSVLSKLRETSKSGGALGQVSNYEEAMLKSALGALNPNLSPEQFKEQLSKVLQILQEIPVKLNNAQQIDQSSQQSINNNDPLGLFK